MFSRRWLRARELLTQRFKSPLHPLGVERSQFRWLSGSHEWQGAWLPPARPPEAQRAKARGWSGTRRREKVLFASHYKSNSL